jgi:hypothetical protein
MPLERLRAQSCSGYKLRPDVDLCVQLNRWSVGLELPDPGEGLDSCVFRLVALSRIRDICRT